MAASQEGSPFLPAPLTCILREEAEIVEGGNARSATSSSGSKTYTDKAESTLRPWPRGISTFTAGKSEAAFPRDPTAPTEKFQGAWKQNLQGWDHQVSENTLSCKGSLKA